MLMKLMLRKDWSVKSLLPLLMVLSLSPGTTNATEIYVVHVQGKTFPYDCESCRLAYPNPDQETRRIISAWMKGDEPFGKRSSEHGGAYSIGAGDTVMVCNKVACVTYTMSSDGLWFDGTYQRIESHPSHPASVSPAQG